MDPAVPGRASKEVVGDWNAVLNQTNVVQNNNKFYRLQLLRSTVGPPVYFCWTHWGRVGEDGQSSLQPCGADQGAAEQQFCQKFRAKTGNTWGADPFVPKSKKYALIDVEQEEVDPKVVQALASVAAGGASRAAAAAAVEAEELESKLQPATLELMRLMFDDVRWSHPRATAGGEFRCALCLWHRVLFRSDVSLVGSCSRRLRSFCGPHSSCMLVWVLLYFFLLSGCFLYLLSAAGRT